MVRSIVIIGSGGRLGAALAREWSKAGYQVRGFNHAQLDLRDGAAIRAALEPLDFDVLVNCAALTNVDRCEREPDEALLVNTVAVTTLAETCARKGVRCIQISTDYVFDGLKKTPYVEEDDAWPISKYGESKRAGEVALLSASERNLAVRVSWVFGPDRPSFVDQVIQRALEHDRVEAIADKVSVPTYTLDAARMLAPLLEAAVGGILHICNRGECTWQEYGQHALDCAAAAGLPLRTWKVEPIRLADMNAFVARRPIYTPLAVDKLTQLTGLVPRPWEEAVDEYVRAYWAPRVTAQGSQPKNG
jgi:dTDP-4-dehydrorhamnose reductase